MKNMVKKRKKFDNTSIGHREAVEFFNDLLARSVDEVPTVDYEKGEKEITVIWEEVVKP